MDAAALQSLFTILPAVLLHVVRATAFLSAVSLLGTGGPSRIARLVVGTGLGAATFFAAGAPVMVFGSVLELAVAAGREALIGLLAGFSIQAVLGAVTVAGDILAHETGLTMARFLDTESGRQDASTTRFLEALVMLLVFELDLHHDALRVVLATHEHVPVGGTFELGPVVAALTTTITGALALGLRLIAPVFAILWLTTVVLVVLARAVPNLNLLEFSFGFRILVAFGATALFLSPAFAHLADVLREQFAAARTLFAN